MTHESEISLKELYGPHGVRHNRDLFTINARARRARQLAAMDAGPAEETTLQGELTPSIPLIVMEQNVPVVLASSVQ